MVLITYWHSSCFQHGEILVKGSAPMKTMAHQEKSIKLALLVCLAVALCMMPCGVAGQHHASAGTPSVLCTVDLPHVFQLVIAWDLLLFATVALTIIPQAPAFALLKPPRSLYSD